MQSVGFLFDMDGVIVDSNPFHKNALQQFCEKYGYNLTEELLKEKVYGRTNSDWLTNLFGDLEPQKLKAYADEKEQLFRDLYENDIVLVDGFKEFLAKLEEYDVPKAIATSAPKENVDFTLAKTRIKKFFPTILDDSFVTKGKPNPQIYLKSAAALNLAPQNCVVFEDSLSGVQAGKQAGCKVVGVTTTHSREELTDTDFVIDNFVGLDPKNLISVLYNK
jgi:HAD superfamily hydrolase (TIGR01509 family)